MKGTYILITRLKGDSKIKIGKLDIINFLKGYYCYIGSALGKSINLENRISRHQRLNRKKTGKLRWHIDYFLTHPDVDIIKINKIPGDKKIECNISDLIKEFAEKSIIGFGCSDCKCKSHFHYFNNKNFEKNRISD